MQWYIQLMTFVVVIYKHCKNNLMKKIHSKIDHVKLFKAHNISLRAHCKVVMCNVYFFLMESKNVNSI